MRRSHGPRPLDRASPLPLWEQLHQDLLRRLSAGAFSDSFPGELELRDEYDVSRHTVREAVRHLREAGLIESYRGRPTTVRDSAIEQPLGSLYSLFRAVEARGMTQHSTVLAQERAISADIAGVLDEDPDAGLLRIERIRYADDEPLAHDEVWLPGRYADAMADADLTHSGLYDQLAARCGVRPSAGSETIHAIIPTAAQRELLGLDHDEACFFIERQTFHLRKPVEYRRTTLRADRYSMIASWTPKGYELAADARPSAGSASSK